MSPSPSRVATWFLARAVPERHREAVLGDLHEEYAFRLRSATVSTADRWYWGQVCRSVPTLVWSSAKDGRWIATLGVALGFYILMGIFEFAATRTVSTLLAPDTQTFKAVSTIVGLLTMALGGYGAAWVRGPAAAGTLALIVFFVVLSLVMTMSGSAPLWYGLTFLIAGPLASLAGGNVCLRHRADKIGKAA
jgi:hypothetical protein